MKSKVSFLSIALYTFLCTSLFAQSREIIKLDGSKKPLEESKSNIHTYNKIISYSLDSTKIEKLYNLDNLLLSTTREKYNPDLGYTEAVTQTYDSLANHVSTKFENVDNDMWLEVFFEDGAEVSRLQYSGNKMYRFDIVDRETPIITTSNPLGPNPKNGLAHFYNYFTKK